MTISRKALCAAYALIALLALIGTWGNISGLLAQHGFLSGTLHFWQDVLVNEASRFIAIDMLFLGLAVVVLMVLEARRLKIPGVWMYIVLGLFIAISAAVPLFLIHRELKLAAIEPAAPAGTLTVLDALGIVALGIAITAYAGFALLG